MKEVIWIEDESNAKDDILMTIESVGGRPTFCPTVTEALRVLSERRDQPPRLIVLDYILPIGMSDQPFCLDELRGRVEALAGPEVRRYTGLLILEAFKDIAASTVAISLASMEDINRHPVAQTVPYFSKLSLPFDWDRLEQELRRVFTREVQP